MEFDQLEIITDRKNHNQGQSVTMALDLIEKLLEDYGSIDTRATKNWLGMIEDTSDIGCAIVHAHLKAVLLTASQGTRELQNPDINNEIEYIAHRVRATAFAQCLVTAAMIRSQIGKKEAEKIENSITKQLKEIDGE